MARPTKPDDQLRTGVVRVRVTLSEKSRLSQNAKEASLTPSDFLRGLALGAKPSRNVPTPDREALLKLLAELNMQGSNLNQIARALNRRQDSPELQGIDITLLHNTLYGVDMLRNLLMQMLR